ncbi:MPPV-082 mutT motif putative gene expression regulator [Magpiepox virus 2]|nr:MPPV-082 mutT motif putative gene expression regulator [Magpiepox virus 2]
MGQYYKNKLLLRPCVFSDNIQLIKLVAYEYDTLNIDHRLSVIGVIKTMDNKFILCHRNNSFLFTEILLSRDRQRKIHLFKQYSKYMSNSEREILSYRLSLPNKYIYNHTDIILPGGKIEGKEGITNCLVREIKEELNIDASYLDVFEECFVHGIIHDKLIEKDFEFILLYVETKLTSEEVMELFIPNMEIKAISFVNIDDIDRNHLYNNVIKYIINAVSMYYTNRFLTNSI